VDGVGYGNVRLGEWDGVVYVDTEALFSFLEGLFSGRFGGGLVLGALRDWMENGGREFQAFRQRLFVRP
jgi:hypothetical protein